MGFLDKIFGKNKEKAAKPELDSNSTVNTFDIEESLLLLALRSEKNFSIGEFDEKDFIENFAEDFPSWNSQTLKAKISKVTPYLNDPVMTQSCFASVINLSFDRKNSALLRPCICSCHAAKSAGLKQLRIYVDQLCASAFRTDEKEQYDAQYEDVRYQIINATKSALKEYNSDFLDFEKANKYFRINKEPSLTDTIKFLQRLTNLGTYEAATLSIQSFASIPILNLMVDYWGVSPQLVWSIAERNSLNDKKNEKEMTMEDIPKILNEMKAAISFVEDHSDKEVPGIKSQVEDMKTQVVVQNSSDQKNNSEDQSTALSQRIVLKSSKILDEVQKSLKTQATDFAPDELKNIRDLHIDLDLDSIETEAVEDLYYFSGIIDLRISNSKINDLSFLFAMKNLEDLWLFNCEIVDISALSQLYSLTTLNLSYNGISDISVFENMEKLMYLNLSHNPINNIESLRGLKNIFSLTLNCCQVKDLKPICNLVDLHNLSCFHNQICDVNPLIKLKKLVEIDLSYNQIQDISPLIKFKKSVKIDLSNNEITDWKDLIDRSYVIKKDQRVPQQKERATTTEPKIEPVKKSKSQKKYQDNHTDVEKGQGDPRSVFNNALVCDSNPERYYKPIYVDELCVPVPDQYVYSTDPDVIMGRELIAILPMSGIKKFNAESFRMYAYHTFLIRKIDQDDSWENRYLVNSQQESLFSDQEILVDSNQAFVTIHGGSDNEANSECIIYSLSIFLKSDHTYICQSQYNFNDDLDRLKNHTIYLLKMMLTTESQWPDIIEQFNIGSGIAASQEAQPPENDKDSWHMHHAISAGENHTIGLKSDGTVVAIGNNDKGQCNISMWSDIISVAAGEDFTVGLRRDGTVVATGNNDEKQCNVSAWKNIVEISAGHSHTVGLTLDGKVVTTGSNSYSQCNVRGLKDVKSVVAGGMNTFGLMKNGEIIPVGMKENDFLYFGQADVENWQNIIEISARGDNTIGLQKNRTVLATGQSVKQTDVDDWADVVAVAAGSFHSLGLLASGKVISTAEDSVSLGIKYKKKSIKVSKWNDIIEIAAGDDFSIGLKTDGTLVSFGKNDDGQCDIESWNSLCTSIQRV